MTGESLDDLVIHPLMFFTMINYNVPVLCIFHLHSFSHVILSYKEESCSALDMFAA